MLTPSYCIQLSHECVLADLTGLQSACHKGTVAVLYPALRSDLQMYQVMKD